MDQISLATGSSVDTVRYGLIGAGMMGREHIRNLAVIPGSSITAVADPHRTSIEAASTLLKNEPALFATPAELLASDACDALIIATPNDTHADILQAIFESGRTLPILVEKPVCTSPADLERLRLGAASYGAPIWVGMEYRYMPPVTMMIEEIHKGRLGPIRMIAIREHRFPFKVKIDNWNRFAARTGGTMVEKCCHFFDLMRLMAQDEPIRVYASGGADCNHRDERYDGRQPDIVDNAFVIVDFASGIRASLDLCMFAEGSWWQEAFSVVGDKAKVECLVPASHGYEEEVISEVIISPRTEQKSPERRLVPVDARVLEAGAHHGSTYYEHQRFREVILGRGQVEVSLDDGLKAVAMGMAAEISIREHRVVEIDGLTLR